MQIDGLACLKQPGIGYVNRAHGAGTRVLLDDLLAEAGMTPSQDRLTLRVCHRGGTSK